MATLKKFESLHEFLEYNSELLHTQYFQHYHLHDLFERLLGGREILTHAYNITDSESSNTILIGVEGLIFIYAEKRSEEVLEILKEELSQINTEEFLFRGSKEVILKLMEMMDFKYNIFNDRVIFDCSSSNTLIKKPKGKFGVAGISDIPTIIKMSVDFYAEEFAGKGQQSHDSATLVG